MKINYDDFRFDKVEGLYYKEHPIADFNLRIIEKKSIWGISNSSADKTYLVESIYTDGRENRKEWIANIKKNGFV